MFSDANKCSGASTDLCSTKGILNEMHIRSVSKRMMLNNKREVNALVSCVMERLTICFGPEEALQVSSSIVGGVGV